MVYLFIYIQYCTDCLGFHYVLIIIFVVIQSCGMGVEMFFINTTINNIIETIIFVVINLIVVIIIIVVVDSLPF